MFISINVNGLWLRGRILQDLRKAAYGSLAFEGILMTKINRGQKLQIGFILNISFSEKKENDTGRRCCCR